MQLSPNIYCKIVHHSPIKYEECRYRYFFSLLATAWSVIARVSLRHERIFIKANLAHIHTFMRALLLSQAQCGTITVK